jgi:hypothetical protein
MQRGTNRENCVYFILCNRIHATPCNCLQIPAESSKLAGGAEVMPAVKVAAVVAPPGPAPDCSGPGGCEPVALFGCVPCGTWFPLTTYAIVNRPAEAADELVRTGATGGGGGSKF